MKIELKEEKLYIDDLEIEISKLTAELLDRIVDKGLKGEVEIIITDESHPLQTFFSKLKEELEPGSAFRKELEELEKGLEKLEEELENIDEVNEEETNEETRLEEDN